MDDRKPFIIFSQSQENSKNDNHSYQLTLPLAFPQKPEIFRQKAQITSSPGVLPKQRDRYRVVFRGAILGDRLSLDEALQLSQKGKQ
jgi:hypothetical protein